LIETGKEIREKEILYITKYVGKGERSGLRILYVKDQETNTL